MEFHKNISLWRDTYKYSIESFCIEYALDIRRFKNMISMKEKYLTGYFYILVYLGIIQHNNVMEYITSQSMSISSWLLKMQYDMLQDSRESISVSFIDIDNMHNFIEKLPTDDYQVVVCTKGSYSQVLLDYIRKDRVYLIITDGTPNNASDIVLTMASTLFIHHVWNKSIQDVYIYSNDSFSHELCSQLRALTTYNVSVISYNPVQENDTSVDNVSVISYNPVQENDTSVDNGFDYVRYYNEHWKGSKAAFCRLYNIDYANFSKYIRGLKKSPMIERIIYSLYLDNTK